MRLTRNKGYNPDIYVQGDAMASEGQRKDTKTVQLIDDLYQEADSKLGESIDGDVTLAESWYRSHRRMGGDHFDHGPKHGEEQVALNLTANAVVAVTSVQTESDMRPEFSAVESDDEPVWFLAERAGMTLLDLQDEGLLDLTEFFADLDRPEVEPIEPGMEDEVTAKYEYEQRLTAAEEAYERMKAAQLAAEAPISHAQAKVVRKLTEPWLAMDGMTMVDATLEDDDLIAVTDALAAGEFQTVHDALFSAARGGFFFKQCEYQKNIFGHQALMFEFTEDYQFKFWCPNVLNVLADPLASCLEEMRYLIYDEFMDADEAKRQFPDHAEDIERAKTTQDTTLLMGVNRGNWGATNSTTSTTSFTSSGRGYGGVDLKRPMVTIRTVWLRHGGDYPLSKQEAVDRGLVLYASQAGKHEGVDVKAEGYYLIERDEESHDIVGLNPIEPGDEDWPIAPGLRQIKTLVEIERIVDDGQCQYSDIPAAWNVNIPIPFCPYGQGEPARLEKLSQIINKLASILGTTVKHYQHQQIVMPASLFNSLKESGVDLFARAGVAWSVDDTLFADYFAARGADTMQMQPPQVPAGYFAMLDNLIVLHDKLSGYSQALQGNAPTSDASGRAIEALVSQARGAIAFKAERTQDALERMGRIAAHAIQTMMPADIWRRYASKYPEAVVEAIREKVKSLRFDVSVSVTGGKGATKRAKGDQARQDFAIGVTDDRTMLEDAGYDADKVIKRKAEQVSREQKQAPSPLSPLAPNTNTNSVDDLAMTQAGAA